MPALYDSTILPHKLTLLHFFAYSNSAASLQACLNFGSIYTRDKSNKTPLEYAMERKSYDCAAILIEYIISKGFNIYQEMS